MNLSIWQWTLLAMGAFFTGLSKTGIAGLGVLSVAIFANALPARTSTGALLPLLLCGDLFGLAYFHKHANASHLWRLFPWVLLGLGAGYGALDRFNAGQMQRLIGAILLFMTALHGWRKNQAGPDHHPMPQSWWFAALTGGLAGFATMVANAAGPVMLIYLLAVGLPKLEFMGTGAWFFMLVNALKVPLSLHLGLISSTSLRLDAPLLLALIPGAFLGPKLLQRLHQERFENGVLALTVVAALRLLLG